MTEEPDNETAVLENLEKMPGEKPHPHFGMEVVCKAGTDSVTIQPMTGYDQHVRYVRTEDKDEKGRVIFRADVAQ